MNDHEEYVQAFVRDVPFDAPDAAHRDALKRELLNAFPRHRLQPTVQPVGVWRTIMKSKKSQLAAAAAILFAAFLVLQLFDKTSDVAWAEVAQRLEEIQTLAYRITSDVKGMPGAPEGSVIHMKQDVYVANDQGAVHVESTFQTPRGLRQTQTYILFEDRAIITVMPRQKKYLKVEIGPEQMNEMEQDNGDPITILKAMLDHDYTELGRKTVDGIPAWGIEVSDPTLGAKMGSLISAGMFDEMTVQLWVDEVYELPIRVTAQGSSVNGRTSIDLVIGTFQWDVDMDPALFIPKIPDDYELLAQTQWEKGREGEEIVEVLRLFLEFADGKYPASLNTMTVAQAIAPALKEKFAEKPGPELIARLMKVDRVGMMVTTLEKEDRDPAYYGDKVSATSSKAVLFRWKLDDDTYRVVFGDLSQRDVTPDELARLEASL
ncbi:MAG: hypothetical protein GY809_25390 [Planctomycetes bacterium]|nr:hypothetical protein [Planctomycetota bacterium]